MVGKGNLAVFESTNISETKEDHAHQNWCACTVTSTPAYMIFLGRFRSIKFFDDHGLYIVHGSEREIWLFLKVPISPKPKRTTPTKIGVHALWHPTHVCMNFLGRFWSIKFFDDHGLYSPWVGKGNLVCFWKYQYLRNREDHAHQNWCACMWHQLPSLHDFFGPIPIN